MPAKKKTRQTTRRNSYGLFGAGTGNIFNDYVQLQYARWMLKSLFDCKTTGSGRQVTKKKKKVATKTTAAKKAKAFKTRRYVRTN
jgi:hypothetical protein